MCHKACHNLHDSCIFTFSTFLEVLGLKPVVQKKTFCPIILSNEKTTLDLWTRPVRWLTRNVGELLPLTFTVRTNRCRLYDDMWYNECRNVNITRVLSGFTVPSRTLEIRGEWPLPQREGGKLDFPCPQNSSYVLRHAASICLYSMKLNVRWNWKKIFNISCTCGYFDWFNRYHGQAEAILFIINHWLRMKLRPL